MSTSLREPLLSPSDYDRDHESQQQSPLMQDPEEHPEGPTEQDKSSPSQSQLSSPSTSQPSSPSSSSSQSSTTTTPPKSKNINLILLYAFLSNSSRSLWNQSVLPAYVYLLKSNDPKYVGFITAIMGISQLLSSFPSGICVDKYGRDGMLRIAAIIGSIAACVLSISTYQESFTTLSISLAIWGVFWGIGNTSISAVFADSIQDGDRSYYFTMRMIVNVLGSMAGPLAALIMFGVLGDEWMVKECAVVIRAGQVVAIPALVLLWFVKDDYCVQHDDDDDDENDDRNSGDDNHDPIGTDDSSNSTVEIQNTASTEEEEARRQPKENQNPLTTPLLLDTNMDAEELQVEHNNDHHHNAPEQKDFFCIPSSRVVPIFVSSADIMGGLAAGMSIRYFPIFFLHNLNLSPAQVQITFASSMAFMAILGRFVQWTGTKIGRIQTVLICKWTGAILLWAMIQAYQTGTTSNFTICTLYVVRTGVINTPSALSKSVLMDHVPKGERGKWSALESVNMMSWAGSAAVGGFLVDAEGILFNFSTTAALQVIATIPYLFVLGRVQRENKSS